MNNIFIQPQLDSYNPYLKLAEKYNFSFEIVDFASPAVLNDMQEYRYRKEFYKHHLASFPNRITLHGAFIDVLVSSPDQAIKRASQEKVRICLETAVELNADSIVFHTGFNPVIRNPSYRANYLQQSALFWRRMAEEYSIEILLENMWESEPNTIAELLDNIYNTKVNVCLDLGHHHVFGRESLASWLNVLGSRVSYLHLSDNKGDIDAHLPLGAGNIDWRGFNNEIQQLTNLPRVVLEVKWLERIEQSIRYLKEHKIYPWPEKNFIS